MAKTVKRCLIPCAMWDMERLESWLEDMAAKGLILEKDGFFLGFLSFIKAEPQNLAYRLEAADTKGGIFADGNGEPADEVIDPIEVIESIGASVFPG